MTSEGTALRFTGVRFSGPLFVVGMPRSGTKLVRALLNQHSGIGLTTAESHFIPFLVRRYGNPPPFRDSIDVEDLLRELGTTPFAAALRRDGRWPEPALLAPSVDPRSWASILERLLRACGSKPDRPDLVWGDKTPGYVSHLPLLAEIFPGARFLHVLRDPRDHCLSVKKSFGKDPIRAADRWRVSVERARRDGASLPAAYLELRYEVLLEDPERAMREVCAFVGVDYENRMIQLESSQEDLGDARGHGGIVRGNSGKWRQGLGARDVERIESIVGEVATAAGYRLTYPGRGTRLGRVERAYRRLKDGVPTLLHHVRHAGSLWPGVRRLIRHRRWSSWRPAQ